MNLVQIGRMTEDEAREYLEKIRWPDGPTCPHCATPDVTRLQGKSTRPGLFQCKAAECRRQFTFMVGTIFEDSHLSCKQWLTAFHLMCSSTKGVSAHQIHRELGITYKTAWHLCHRIRYALVRLNHGRQEVEESHLYPLKVEDALRGALAVRAPANSKRTRKHRRKSERNGSSQK